MKKLLFFLLLSVFAFGQTKKTTKPKLTEKQKIEKMAKEYFEKEYVQVAFKDPYSYKLQKILVADNSTERVYNELIQNYTKQIEKTDTVWSFKKIGFAKEDLAALQRYFNDSVQKDKDNYEKYPSANNESSYKISLSVYEENKKKYDSSLLSAQSEHDLIVKELKKAISDKSSLEESMKALTDIEKQRVLNYTVYIDAYGANSYGNKILGRYYFTVDRQGNLIGSIRSFN